jgi:hypothetical protein
MSVPRLNLKGNSMVMEMEHKMKMEESHRQSMNFHILN